MSTRLKNNVAALGSKTNFPRTKLIFDSQLTPHFDMEIASTAVEHSLEGIASTGAILQPSLEVLAKASTIHQDIKKEQLEDHAIFNSK
jgi:hypothetical protein